VPQDIHLTSPAKNHTPESESPKVDKPPSPSTGKPSQKCRSTQAQKTLMPQLVWQVIQLSHLSPTQDVMLLTNPQGQIPPSVKKHRHRVLSLLDLELMVDHQQVRDHLCQGLKSNNDNTRVLLSHYGTIQNSSRLDSTLADM
jgi:hypothetical protein